MQFVLNRFYVQTFKTCLLQNAQRHLKFQQFAIRAQSSLASTWHVATQSFHSPLKLKSSVTERLTITDTKHVT